MSVGSTCGTYTAHLHIQGLLLEWNFNQAEALRAFELAAEADPSASMPHWGIAYALGPGANRWSCLSCSFHIIHVLYALQAVKKTRPSDAAGI